MKRILFDVNVVLDVLLDRGCAGKHRDPARQHLVVPGQGALGPGRALQQTLGQQGEVVATCFCGDNYFAEHLEEATEELLGQMANFKPQLLIAGPAFESGRYGVACGAIGQAAQERLSIPAVAGMDAENAGTGVYRKKVYIVDSGSSVVRMAPVLQRMTALGLKLVQGMPLGRPEEEGYFPRGIKRNAFATKPPAERAVDMLLAKIRGEPFESEIATPQFHHIKPAAAVRDWAYTERGLERVISLIDPRNVRSIRVADKLGAEPEQLVQMATYGPAIVWLHPRR